MKPSGSHYPQAFDNDGNLYLVKDALTVPLAIDYYPGAPTIIAEGDISKFPPSGIITLIDQCAPAHERAVSFYYGGRTSKEFQSLELLSELASFKPKMLTKITMQVMADHRESLKEAIISIEKFIGAKHDVANAPNGKTIFSRLNFLRTVLFSPKAWFEADVVTGIVPLTVKFTFSGSGNVGPVGDVIYSWKFNDEEIKTLEPLVEKTFIIPGNYTIGLTIKNTYGEDSVTFVDMIKIKNQPPEEASIEFEPQGVQFIKDGKLRTPVNQPVHVQIPQKLADNKTKTLAGELLDSKTNKVTDAIMQYDWKLGDMLPHSKAASTKALYSIGGFYDAVVKTKTEKGCYRTTTSPKAIDVVEPINLWLWSINNKQIKSYEFGLISEVFKTSPNVFNLNINDSFLDDDRQKFEFWRNNGIVTKDKSGLNGTALLFWASGRSKEDESFSETVNAVEYNGFTDTYKAQSPLISRPWNWASLISKKNIYFIFGTTETFPTLSPTNQTRSTYNLDSKTVTSDEISSAQYLNGSENLMKHSDVFDISFNAFNGHFAAYRTVWKANTGYILRNSHLGGNFTFRDFYKTSGVISMPFQQILKLPDLPGDWHKEGDLIALEHGVYFFNNQGGVYCFNDVTNIWESVPSHNRIAKNNLDKLLVAAVDNKAYISIDADIFFRFNEIDMSYNTLPSKPVSKQWTMTLF